MVRKKAATSDIVLGIVGGKSTSLRELRDRAIIIEKTLRAVQRCISSKTVDVARHVAGYRLDSRVQRRVVIVA